MFDRLIYNYIKGLEGKNFADTFMACFNNEKQFSSCMPQALLNMFEIAKELNGCDCIVFEYRELLDGFITELRAYLETKSYYQQKYK